MGTDDLRVDAEILELELDLARERVERLLRIPLDLLLRFVEQRQRRQFARRDAGEQRDLLFALGTLALFDRREHGLDLERLALGLLDRVDLAHFLALHARGARDAHVLDLLRIRAEPAERRVEAAPDRVHELEPRQAGGERHRDEKQRDEEEFGAEVAEAVQQRAADDLAEDAAAAAVLRRQAVADEAQVAQTAAAEEEQHAAEQAKRRPQRGVRFRVVFPEQCPADREQQQRKYVRDVAEQVEHDVGDVRADAPADVADLRRLGFGVRPARIVRVIAEQTREQIHHDRQQDDDGYLAQHTLRDADRGFAGFC